jgi:hypothetical protein
LTGRGAIDGHVVNCVALESVLAFRSTYTPQPKDLADMAALRDHFGIEAPVNYPTDE